MSDFLAKAKKRVQQRKAKAHRDRTMPKVVTPEGTSLQTNHQSKFTEERVEKILHGISSGANQATCAQAAGISQGTLSRWKEKGRMGKQPYASFLTELERREAQFEIDCLEEIRMNGGWKGRAWILERRNPKKWSTKVEHKHDHTHDHRHKITGFIPDNGREAKQIADAEFEVVDG